MERIFPNLGPGQAVNDVSGDPEDDYESSVKALIEDSVSYENEFLAADRKELIEHYNGTQPLADEGESRSSFVSTDVRDTIMGVLPSLVRIFATNEHVVDFVPNSSEDSEMAAQATDYVNHIFWDDNDGFSIIYAVLKDALTVRTGITKWYTESDVETKVKKFSGITVQQLQMLVSENPSAEFFDGVVSEELSPDGSPTLSVSMRYSESKPMVHVEAVPPEEFRISRNAKSIYKSRLVGHEYIAQASDLVRMGYDIDLIRGHLTSSTGTNAHYSDERFIRNPGSVDSSVLDDGVIYGEYYIRIDGDGDGIDELRYICTIGENYEIVHDEEVEYVKMALWCPDPTPHTAIGESVADQVMDVQRIKSNMIRNALDNLANVVVPRTAINETVTNFADAMNLDQSAVIRTKGRPSEAVFPITTPFVGQAVFETGVTYMDQVRASRTGITEASKGLDPKAMQSTAVSGIDAIVTGAQERIELIAYVLAETAFKPMFKGLLREITDNPNPERTIQLRGKWVNVDPSKFDPNMKVKTNPTLGKGTDTIRLMALKEVKETQTAIIGKYGIKNPVVGPIQLLNTIKDILAIANIKDTQRYFLDITPEVQKSIMETPEEPDPATLLARAEIEKVKANTAKAIADADHQDKKLAMEDDFRRDKLNVDSTLKAAEIVANFQASIISEPVLESMNQPGE